MSLAGALTATELSSGMGPTMVLAEASFIPTGHATMEPIDPAFSSVTPTQKFRFSENGQSQTHRDKSTTSEISRLSDNEIGAALKQIHRSIRNQSASFRAAAKIK